MRSSLPCVRGRSRQPAGLGSSPGRVLVTGSSGRGGRGLMPALKEQDVAFDLPDDVLDAAALRAAIGPCEQVVHLAWSMQTENYKNDRRDPANIEMARAVLATATDTDVQRVVLVSSVHASKVG